MNIVFLPVTAPGDDTYGSAPTQIRAYPNASIRQVCYPSLVWYNEAVQKEAIAQIREWGVRPLILAGYSKSGLGAWNIARTIPDLVSATIIFDAPVARKCRPPWGTAPFYANDAEWQKDLPLLTMHDFVSAMPEEHRLILISGSGFHEEMSTLSKELRGINAKHIFLPFPDMKHHWDSGWIEAGLHEILQQDAV